MIYQCLISNEDATVIDDLTTSNNAAQDASTLVNSVTANGAEVGDNHVLLSSKCNKSPDNKNMVNKDSIFQEKVVSNGKPRYYLNQHVACCTPKVDRVSNHLLIEQGEIRGMSGEDVSSR